MMDTSLIGALRQLDCGEKHIRLYKAAFDGGPNTLPVLAKKARLQRSTAYVVGEELVAQGLLLENHQSYGQLYSAAEPKVVMQKLASRHRQVGRRLLAFKEALPDLQAAYQHTTTRPRVRTYEGKVGLLAIWNDILAENQEVLLWTNQTAERRIFDARAHEQFIRERIAKQIPVRVLAVDTADGRHLVKSDTVSLRQTRLLPASMSFTSELYIYGEKTAFLDVGNNIFGVLTENRQIADTQRSIFESFWQLLAS